MSDESPDTRSSGVPESAPAPPRREVKLVLPRLRDPRVTLALFLTVYTVLGQTVLYFNRDVKQILLAVGSACLAEMGFAYVLSRVVLFPISAYITGLGLGLLLESYDWRIYVIAPIWGIASNHFILT